MEMKNKPDKWGIVARKRSYQQAYIWSLVLHSVHLHHTLVQQGGEWLILVAEDDRAEAIAQIASFEQENRNWPPPTEEPPAIFSFRDRQPPTLLLMGFLLIFYGVTGSWKGGSRWFEFGAVNHDQIVEYGQWWRLVTGLTLHADPVHVLGNVIIGGIVIHFLCKILGSGLGWFLVIMAGTLGNGINIFLRTSQHLSVGFSTAVFGAIGILTGLELKRQMRLRGILLPLGAGGGLLAMLGSEGERTDLGAHFWGLVAGLLLGFLVAYLPSFLKWSSSWSRQFFFFLLAVLTVTGSWVLAFF